MTSPIRAIGGFSPVDAVTKVGESQKAAGTQATSSTSGTDFAGMLSAGLASVQAAQTKPADLATQVANGTLGVHAVLPWGALS